MSCTEEMVDGHHVRYTDNHVYVRVEKGHLAFRLTVGHLRSMPTIIWASDHTPGRPWSNGWWFGWKRGPGDPVDEVDLVLRAFGRLL